MVRLPTQLAIVRSRYLGEAASSFPSALSARLIIVWVALVVAFETPPGQATCRIVPGSDLTVIARLTPAGTHGMSQHRYVITQQVMSDRLAWIGLLMTAGACFELPRISKISSSSRLVMASTPV